MALPLFALAFVALRAGAAPPACSEDAARLCPDASDSGARLECLARAQDKISETCRREIERTIEAKRQASARSGGSLGGFGGANAFGPPIPLFSIEGRMLPGNGGESRQTEEKFNLSTPVYRSSGDVISASAAGAYLRVGESIVLDNGRRLASDWTRAEVGAQSMSRLDGGRSWGTRASIGYAGDDPGDAPKDAAYSVSVNYGFPSSGGGRWMLFLYAANNSPLANSVPIPGALYFWQGEDLTVAAGFPISSIQWTPARDWTFSASVFGFTAQAEAAYGSFAGVQTFLSYGYLTQSFIPSVRDADRDRFYLREQKLGFGARFAIAGSAQIELQAGQSFDRVAYVSASPVQRDGGQAALADAAYASAAFKWAF